MRMRFWRTRPPAYASTLAPFSSVTRKFVFGSTSSTVPSISNISSLGMTKAFRAPVGAVFGTGGTTAGGKTAAGGKLQPPLYLCEEPLPEGRDRRAVGDDLRTDEVIGRLRLDFERLEGLAKAPGGDVGVDQGPQRERHAQVLRSGLERKDVRGKTRAAAGVDFVADARGLQPFLPGVAAGDDFHRVVVQQGVVREVGRRPEAGLALHQRRIRHRRHAHAAQAVGAMAGVFALAKMDLHRRGLGAQVEVADE